MTVLEPGRRQLTKTEIEGLVDEWQQARWHGEKPGGLAYFLGFDHDEMRRWEETGEPPYGN